MSEVNAKAIVNYLRAAQSVDSQAITPHGMQVLTVAERFIRARRPITPALYSSLVAVAFQVGEYLSPETVTTWDHRGWRLETRLPSGDVQVRCGRSSP